MSSLCSDQAGEHRTPGLARHGFTWPRWALTARIAGAYFHPRDSDASIATQLDALVSAHVSVVLADSPWGEQYAVWVDDAKFWPVQQLVSRVVEQAHARNLKVVLYQTGLELLSDEKRNPGAEHPDWIQRALDGRAILFNDVTVEQQHWLRKGIWDCWLSPCDEGPYGTYRKLCLSRLREMVKTGIDGLWVDEVYLQSSVGSHHDLWPSADSCSARAFRAATGLQTPAVADWGDPVFRRWVVWRHSQIADFLLAEKEAARAIRPDLVFLNENSDLDTGRSTYVANDPTSYSAYPDMTTGHEVGTIADRMDQGETGMKNATLDEWIAFRTMVAFARAADRGKPSWVLTYGYEPRDSGLLAGMVLAEGGNFYETRGPQMADTVGLTHRAELFRWIAEHEDALYAGESCAHVGVLYSPRTRDLVDRASGEPYDPAGSSHLAAYRGAARLLYRAHVPFDVVIDVDTASFSRYRVLIAPEVQAMSDYTAAALRQFTGVLITSGRTGIFDEWLNPRSANALEGVPHHHFGSLNRAAIALADTGLLATRAPASLQLGLRRTPNGYSLVLVNTARRPAPPFRLGLRVTAGEQITGCQLAIFGGDQHEVPFSLSTESKSVELEVPARIDILALLTLNAAESAGSAQPPMKPENLAGMRWEAQRSGTPGQSRALRRSRPPL